MHVVLIICGSVQFKAPYRLGWSDWRMHVERAHRAAGRNPSPHDDTDGTDASQFVAYDGHVNCPEVGVGADSNTNTAAKLVTRWFETLLQADVGFLGTQTCYLACLVAALWRLGDLGAILGHWGARGRIL